MAALTGLLTALCFPPFDLFFILPVCLVPVLFSIRGKGFRDGMRMGYVAGLVYFATLLWWIAPTISTYGSMPIWASWPVLGLLVCYLALYPALWAGLGAMVFRTRYPAIAGILLLPAAWTLIEWLRSHVLTGFPWGLLAYALEPEHILIQAGDVFGPLGLSFAIVLTNVCFFTGLQRYKEAGNRAIAWIALAAFPAAALWTYGEIRTNQVQENDYRFPEMRVAAVQGSIPQDRKWDPEFQERTLDIYRALTLSVNRAIEGPAAPGNASVPWIVVWPETATPFFFQEKGPLHYWMVSFAQEIGAPILFGSPAYKRTSVDDVQYLNSAFLLKPDGVVAGRYDKRHLVPFGEYLPWGWLTFWARDMIPRIGDFTPGTSPSLLCYDKMKAGVLVCFESIFPGLARESVEAGANLLAVLTNDAWFGRTGAPYQHEAMAVFRAVETRRWVVRAANTGISSIITPWGTRTGKTGLFQPAYLTGTVHLRTDRTLYSRTGDLPVLTSCLFLVLISCYILWKHSSPAHGDRKGPGR